MTPTQRRVLIRKFIDNGEIATQEDLRSALETKGVSLNQATLSRDLAAIGARRVSLPEGGTVYELGEAAPVVPALAFETLVVNVVSNGQMVVVHTSQGAASAVALMVDSAKLKDVLGTIAGDDTVFVAPRKASRADSLAEQLWRALGKGVGR